MNSISKLFNYRLQKAKDNLKSAELLYEKEYFPQSINRSYSAIYNSIRALLAFNKFDSDKHSAIISFFDKEYIKTEKIDKQFSKILHNAEEISKKSEYEDFFSVTKDDAEEQLAHAILFINEIEHFTSKLLEQ
jgi:uncharacterized protein (UPF0332 family)